jgi:hypothetical protein
MADARRMRLQDEYRDSQKAAAKANDDSWIAISGTN